MDGSKQIDEMVRFWAETQKRLWDSWLAAAQNFGKTQGTEVWNQTLNAWRTSVQQTLDAQAQLIRAWGERFNTTQDTPEEMRAWARQGQDMLQRWTDAQKQIWDDWFDIAKQFNPAPETGISEREGQNMLQAWQETVQRAIEAQSEWVRLWTTGQAGKGTESEPRSGA